MSDARFIPARKPNVLTYRLVGDEQQTVMFHEEHFRITLVTINQHADGTPDRITYMAIPVQADGTPKPRAKARSIWNPTPVEVLA